MNKKHYSTLLITFNNLERIGQKNKCKTRFQNVPLVHNTINGESEE